MATVQDIWLAKLALRAELLTSEALQESLREQQELTAGGQAVPLAQILVRKRLVAPQQLVSLMKTIESMAFECPRCHARLPAASVTNPVIGARCPRCGTGMTAVSDTGEPVTERLRRIQISEVTGPGPSTNAAPTPHVQSDSRRGKFIQDTRVDSVPPSSHRRALTGMIRDAADDVPKSFGPYEILSELGRGGMGVVYKVRDPKLDRVVALKVLLAGDLSSRTQVQRFKREAELAGRLKHPGIVPIHDVGQIGTQHYFTMDFIEGRALNDRVKARDLSATEAAEIARDMGKALGYAHEQSVMHRDVKPANIIVDKQGHAYIMDFGLAREVGEEDGARLTREGAAVGTPFYMSPEQTRGDRDAMGPPSDIYSLGVVLYEMLCFELPFTAKNQVELTRKILMDEPAKPSSIDPTISPDLDTIVLKAMRKEPAERYTSAKDLAADLDRYLAGTAITARPEGLGGRVRAAVRRNKGVFLPALLISATTLVVTVGTLLFIKKLRALDEEDKATAVRLANDQAEKQKRETDERKAKDEAQKKVDAEAALLRAEAAFRTADSFPTAEKEAYFQKLRDVQDAASAAITNDPTRLRPYILRARARELSHDADGAIADYDEVRKRAPDSPEGAEAAYREARVVSRKKNDEPKAMALLADAAGKAGGGVFSALAQAYRALVAKPTDLEGALKAVDAAQQLDGTCPEVYYVKALALSHDPKAATLKPAIDCLTTCLGSEQKNPRAYALRAQLRMIEGPREDAQDDVRRALDLDPDDVLALVVEAELLSADHPADAIRDYEKLLKQQAPHEDGATILACVDLLVTEQRWEEARALALRATQVDPTADRAYSLLADLDMQAGNPDAAIADLEAGLEPCSANPEAYRKVLKLAVTILASRNALDAAQALVQKEIAAKPDEPQRRLMLAMIDLTREPPRLDDAMRVIQAVEKDVPACVEAYKAECSVLLGTGHSANVPGLADRATKAAPKDPAAWDLAALIFEQLDRHEQALAAARQGVEVAPGDAQANATLAQMEYKSELRKEAYQHAETALRIDPTNADALTVEGALRMGQKQVEAAIGLFRRALKYDPSNVTAIQGLGTAYLEGGHPEQAIPILERLLQAMGPEDIPPETVKVLCVAYVDVNRDKDAEAKSRYLCQKEPDDPDGWAIHALALLHLGQRDTARADLAKALKLDPKASSALVQKAKAELGG